MPQTSAEVYGTLHAVFFYVGGTLLNVLTASVSTLEWYRSHSRVFSCGEKFLLCVPTQCERGSIHVGTCS